MIQGFGSQKLKNNNGSTNYLCNDAQCHCLVKNYSCNDSNDTDFQ